MNARQLSPTWQKFGSLLAIGAIGVLTLLPAIAASAKRALDVPTSYHAPMVESASTANVAPMRGISDVTPIVYASPVTIVGKRTIVKRPASKVAPIATLSTDVRVWRCAAPRPLLSDATATVRSCQWEG